MNSTPSRIFDDYRHMTVPLYTPARCEGKHAMLSKLHDMHSRDGVGEIVAAQVTALQGLHEASHKLVLEVDLGERGGEGIERPAHRGTTIPF